MSKHKLAKSFLVYHLVWCTHQRQPLITPPLERAIYRCIEQQARKLKCRVLAINGMPDHVHLIVRAPATLSPAQIMKQIKGVSSTFVRQRLRPGDFFKWRDSCFAGSLCDPTMAKVMAYVNNQKQHHAGGTVWLSMEIMDDEGGEKDEEDENEAVIDQAEEDTP